MVIDETALINRHTIARSEWWEMYLYARGKIQRRSRTLHDVSDRCEMTSPIFYSNKCLFDHVFLSLPPPPPPPPLINKCEFLRFVNSWTSESIVRFLCLHIWRFVFILYKKKKKKTKARRSIWHHRQSNVSFVSCIKSDNRIHYLVNKPQSRGERKSSLLTSNHVGWF